MRHFTEDHLTDEQVAAYAADHRAALRQGPEKQAEAELKIRRMHAEDTVARELRKVSVEEYVHAGLGSPKRLAELYIQAETLLRSGHLPQRVWDAMDEISQGFLGALRGGPSDTEEAIQAKTAALVFYLDADADLEIDSTFVDFAREIRAARSRPPANDNPPAAPPAAVAGEEAQGEEAA